MKLIVEKSEDIKETEIHIKCNEITEDLDKIIATINLFDNIFVGKIDDTSYLIKASDIFYFESIENKVFVYTNDSFFETSLKIYQIEDKLKNTVFVRISKSTIINLRKITSIKTENYGRLIAELNNKEKIVISRQYMPIIKTKLGI